MTARRSSPFLRRGRSRQILGSSMNRLARALGLMGRSLPLRRPAAELEAAEERLNRWYERSGPMTEGEAAGPTSMYSVRSRSRW